jgi:hypothetical protein
MSANVRHVGSVVGGCPMFFWQSSRDLIQASIAERKRASVGLSYWARFFRGPSSALYKVCQFRFRFDRFDLLVQFHATLRLRSLEVYPGTIVAATVVDRRLHVLTVGQ